MRHSMIRSSVLAALMLCGTALPLTAQEKEPIKKEEPKILESRKEEIQLQVKNKVQRL